MSSVCESVYRNGILQDFGEKSRSVDEILGNKIK